MALCEKCGGQISEEMKFCEKCGTPILKTESDSVEEIQADSEQTTFLSEPEQPAQSLEQPLNSDVINSVKNGIREFLISKLPENFTTPGNTIFHWIGFCAYAILCAIYLVCFFVFMNEMCAPVALGTVGNMSGASSLWMVVYFALGLLPLYFCYKSFKPETNKIPAIISVIAFAFLTVFMFIVWCICDPADFTEALNIYAGDSQNIFAWYVLSDCLSELWYVKLILSGLSVLGFGIDYFINKER